MQNNILVELKKIVLLAIVLVLFSTTVMMGYIKPVAAQGIIYIRADGSVDPPTANITSSDNVTYTLTSNIVNQSIVVERDNIVVDGAGYTLQGTGRTIDPRKENGKGIDLSYRSNVTIKDMEIKAFGYGIWLNMSSKITISKNNITNNGLVFDFIAAGIYFKDSSGNTISGNNIMNNSGTGLLFWNSSNNSVIGNTFFNNGLYVLDSFQNVVESNLVNGKPLVYLEDVSNYTVDNAGQVILVNCDNILVENLDLSNTSFGVELWRTNSTNIVNNTMTNNGDGITLFEYSSNNSISGNNITNNYCGVNLGGASNNSVSGNNITNNGLGITLGFSFNNTVTNNIITNTNVSYFPTHGLDFYGASNNTICKNTVENHYLGIYLDDFSSNNVFYHNNFVNNTEQVIVLHESINCWNYSLEGNYWSNYVGVDLDHDGIGDATHYICSGNVDNYPLMGMFYDFTVEIELGQIYHVYVVSNSTVSDLQVLWWLTSPNEYLQPGDKFIHFDVAGGEGSVGFCRIMIPRVVLNDSYIVLVDWNEIPATELPISNSTCAYLYFTYNHSEQEVIIIPEFPTLTPILLLLIAFTVAIAIYKRRLPKTPIH